MSSSLYMGLPPDYIAKFLAKGMKSKDFRLSDMKLVSKKVLYEASGSSTKAYSYCVQILDDRVLMTSYPNMKLLSFPRSGSDVASGLPAYPSSSVNSVAAFHAVDGNFMYSCNINGRTGVARAESFTLDPLSFQYGTDYLAASQSPFKFMFGNGGTVMFRRESGYGGNWFRTYQLSTPYSPSTAVQTAQLNLFSDVFAAVKSQVPELGSCDAVGFDVTADGRVMVACAGTDYVMKGRFLTPWDMSTFVPEEIVHTAQYTSSALVGIALSPDCSRLVLSTRTDGLVEFEI